MRRTSTILTSAAAAAFGAVAVTVAVPALGQDPPAKKPAAKVEQGPDEATLRACLTDHGVTPPGGDGYALKRWVIGARTAAEKAALEACGMIRPDAGPKPGAVKGGCARPVQPGDEIRPAEDPPGV